MKTSRRRFLSRAAALAAVACTPEEGGESAKETAADSGVATTADFSGALSPTTANADFYTVSITGAPTVDSASWTLSLQNLAGESVVLSLDELRALGASAYERTLTCISSRSGSAIGNAVWEGIRVAELFAAVGLDIDADWVWVEAVDGYTTCLPAGDIDAGMRVVWTMNGEDLPADHGGPARVLTPGRYGMKNPKWITRITLVSAYAEGFWESFGWSDEATNQLQAWFLSPPDDTAVAAGTRVELQGCAFAGAAGISRVEVSTDGGGSWEEAEITYAGGPDVWTLWRFSWTAPASGATALVVRATDGAGKLQVDAEDSDSELDGLESFHGIVVSVA